MACLPRPHEASGSHYCNKIPVSTAGGLGANATIFGLKTVPVCHSINAGPERKFKLEGPERTFTMDAQDCSLYCSRCTSATMRNYSEDPASVNWVATHRIKVSPR